MEKFLIDRDDNFYLAFPDVVDTGNGELIAVYLQTTHHGDRTGSKIVLSRSFDEGRTWSPRQIILGGGDELCENGFYNCARICRLRDGRIALVADRIYKDENTRAEVELFFSDDGGQTFGAAVKTGCQGIVPDKLLQLPSGRILLSAHFRSDGAGTLEQYLWYSDDGGQTFGERITLASDSGLNLCEVSLLQMDDDGKTIVAFMRENSGLGYDCQKCISHDGGMSWSKPVGFPLPGCHRPVAGFLRDGHILITHRFMQGGRGWLGSWTQNFFAALTDCESALSTSRQGAAARILPVDFDRSANSDTGYSGWTQLADGSVFVINYIVDDAPKGQIRGYRLRAEDFLL